MEGHVVLAHREPVQMLEAFCELVGVAAHGDQTDGLLVVDAVGDGQAQLFLHGVLHVLLEGEAVAVDPVPHLGGQHEVEVDKALELLGQMDPLGEAEQWQHGQGYPEAFLGVFFKKAGLESLLEGAAHWVEGRVLRL